MGEGRWAAEEALTGGCVRRHGGESLQPPSTDAQYSRPVQER